MSDDRVWTITGEGPKDISIPIKGAFVGLSQASLRQSAMAYSSVDRSLYFLKQDNNFPTAPSVFRYTFEYGAWTVNDYGHSLRSISSTQYRDTLTVGELSGTVGSLSGVIGDLGVSNYQSGILLVSGDPLSGSVYWVEREAPDLNGSTAQSVSTSGVQTGAFDCSWTTGVIRASDQSRWVHLHEMEVAYARSDDADVTGSFVSISTETPDSPSWSNILFARILVPTGASEATMTDGTLRIPLNLHVPHVRLQMTLSLPSHLRLLDWRIRVTDGARRSMHA